MISVLSSLDDDFSFEVFTELCEIEREVQNEITQLKISRGNALDYSFDVHPFIQRKKELYERVAELELNKIRDIEKKFTIITTKQ